MALKRKHILILGAGFAGLRVARQLSKRSDLFKITLVDKQNVHIYTPDLYEVASNFHEEITEECMVALKETVATPIRATVDPKKVTFVQGEITGIDPQKKSVSLKKGNPLRYDTLVVCLGSVTNYYGIEGLRQFSYPVKTMEDAIAINCHLDTFFKELWKKERFKEVMITIGGGGVTGVEFASELPGYLNLLSKKYKFPRSKIKLQIIQGGNELIGHGKKLSDWARTRLVKKGIKIVLGQYISKVMPNSIELKSKRTDKLKTIHSDLLIWTGGVQVNPLVASCLGSKESRGAIPVNSYMQSLDHPHVYAGGDNVFYEDASGCRVPLLAQSALEEGTLIAENIIRHETGRPLKAYTCHEYPMIIPIAGKYGIFRFHKWLSRGLHAWVLRRFTDLKYAMEILPFWKALQKWQHGNKIFIEND